MPPRLASRIDAPDRLLFPARYKARSALFHAGMELKFMHIGLWLLGWLPRFGLIKSLEPFVPPLKWMADRLERFGTDRGGMTVYAIGRDVDGAAFERRWTLIAEAGDGPETPPTPAFLLARKLLAGEGEPGARPAAGVLTLDEIEAELAEFRIAFSRSETPSPTLFERALGQDFPALPPAWRRLADIHDVDHFAGVSSIERGTSLLSRLVGWVMGFPLAAENVPVLVRKQKTASGEIWTRDFGGRKFHSHLSRRSGDAHGVIHERFGPMSFRIRLTPRDGSVEWPVEGWRFLGIPMPRWLRPRSETSEFLDQDGRFRFDVGISLPLAGFVVRYRGWLKPVEAEDGAELTIEPAAAVQALQAQPPMPSNSTVER